MERLDVHGFGMFPGTAARAGLGVEFKPGLTLVLGANGLGKSTLITMIYRMMTGPYEIPGLPGASSLGSRSLEATRLQRWDRRIFAARVNDDAADAQATLVVSFGTDKVEITRSLHDLTLLDLKVNGRSRQGTEDSYQRIILDLTELPTFGDFILILRFLVFYFEDRHSLIWDPTAQRQILRLLLLPTKVASAWARHEREVLELDSRVRNLRNALNKEEKEERTGKAKATRGTDVPRQIEDTEAALSRDDNQLSVLEERLPALEAARQQARLLMLTAEQERESEFRRLETLQLSRIEAAFPSYDEAFRYLFGRLLSTGVCQTCGTEVPDFVVEIEERIRSSRCAVCDSAVQNQTPQQRATEKKIAAQAARVDSLDIRIEAASEEREQAEKEYDAALTELQRLRSSIATNRATLNELIRKLPPDERTLRAQSQQVTTLRAHLAGLQRELDERRTKFDQVVRRDIATIARERDKIISVFKRFAEGFLFEQSELRWAPHKTTVGQTGRTFEFPAFELEMTGSDFATPVRRSSADQVSESQREFVDLAFRMALMDVAGYEASGSMVVDAPEASLDAVFAHRAAAVLVRFADTGMNNRLVTTSNLVDGQLVPEMLRAARITSPKSPRVVDLLTIATPTAALRELRDEYRDLFDRMFGRRAAKQVPSP
ncbi:MAG TPA: AAA family ATPase [Frankiaceae bacterium]|nr:AAA family ATPase [Frankiaceae bacterium]